MLIALKILKHTLVFFFFSAILEVSHIKSSTLINPQLLRQSNVFQNNQLLDMPHDMYGILSILDVLNLECQEKARLSSKAEMKIWA